MKRIVNDVKSEKTQTQNEQMNTKKDTYIDVLAKGKQEDIGEFSCEYIQGPLCYITVARQMKMVTFVQSQMNIR